MNLLIVFLFLFAVRQTLLGLIVAVSVLLLPIVSQELLPNEVQNLGANPLASVHIQHAQHKAAVESQKFANKLNDES